MLNYFIRNRISTFMLIAGLCLSSLISMRDIPVSLMPSVESPALSVIIEYPGVDPDKIETIITKPVEKIIKSVEGIEEIYSSSEEGKARINITFSSGRDIKISALKVREKLEFIKDSFPKEVQDPLVIRYDPTQRPVVIAAVDIKGETIEEIRDYTEKRIKPHLQRIEGVSEINISGGQIKEIHIEVDKVKLLARGISIPEISSSINNSNISIPGGVLESESENRIVYVPGRLDSIEDIKNISIALSEKGPIKVSEVSSVLYSYREREDLSRHNGSERVSVYVHCAGGANVLDVSRTVIDALNKIDGVKVEIIYNQGEYIDSSVTNALFSGIWGVIVVFLVIIFFFNSLQSVLPIVISIPVSMIIVPLFLYFGNKGFNLMSISGFALSAGMVVDNGVVIIDAMSSSKRDIKSIISSIASVRSAVVSSTFTTIAVFLPLVLFNKKAGDTYGDLAFTITCALLISLVVSMIFVPALYLSIIDLISKKKISFPGERITGLSSVFEGKALFYYSRLLNFSLSGRGMTITIIMVCAAVSMILSTKIKSDRDFDANVREFNLYLEFPTGTSLSKTNTGVREVESSITKVSGIESISSKVEKWKGTLTVKVGKNNVSKREQMKSDIKNKAHEILKKYEGFAYTSEAMADSQQEITIHFYGNDSDVLKQTAKFAASRVKSIDGVDECLLRFRDGKPEYAINIDESKAGLSKLTNFDIAERIRSGLFGPVITKFISDGREMDVRLRYMEDQRKDIKHLLAGMIKNRNGEMIPLREVTEVQVDKSPTRIYRLNGRRCQSITVKSSLLSFQELTYRIKETLDAMNYSDEYGWEFDSMVEKIKEEKMSLILSVMMSIVIVYMILASLFESLKLPLMIMLTIPLSLVGVIIVMFITSTSFTSSVYLGLIVLSGIVVNNGIILVDLINRKMNGLVNHKNTIRKVITESVHERFRPVLITTVTTIFGMFPMVLSGGEGSGIWRPFALTVISGMFFSTALTLVVIPVCCDIYYEKFSGYKKADGVCL